MYKYVLLVTLMIFPYSVKHAFAHIEAGDMPDSVAEMEYRILLEFEPLKHDIRNKLAGVLFRLKKYKESKEEFRLVLEKDPQNYESLVGMGQLLIHDAQWPEAETRFLTLQKTHPDAVELSYFLGVIYKETGRSKKAESILTEALARLQAMEQTKKTSSLINDVTTVLETLKSPSAASANTNSL